MYKKFFKRFLDFFLSLFALIVLSPILIILIFSGIFFMRGNPFFFQKRPGKKDRDGKEQIFTLIKFRTMDNRKDKNGNFLPDDVRLNKYGRFLRSTSLDELPELFNILKGDMSIIGPRPQLVRDMVFMTNEQRERHNVRPGLSGLAQVRGRNSINWEEKLDIDLEYIATISLYRDIKIILETVYKVIKREGITEEGMETAEDYGDYLLSKGRVSEEEYIIKQKEAEELIRNSK